MYTENHSFYSIPKDVFTVDVLSSSLYNIDQYNTQSIFFNSQFSIHFSQSLHVYLFSFIFFSTFIASSFQLFFFFNLIDSSFFSLCWLRSNQNSTKFQFNFIMIVQVVLKKPKINKNKIPLTPLHSVNAFNKYASCNLEEKWRKQSKRNNNNKKEKNKFMS